MSKSERRFRELLERHHVRKTGHRLSVLGILSSREGATSQPDLEEIMGRYINRVTLYRILKTFEEKGIIHKVVDLNGTANYALCTSDCTEHGHRDQHVHFKCQECNRLYCVDTVRIPSFKMPEGFEMDAIHLVVSGKCPKCSTDK
ncbi:MAG TPA: transcriptional repressor [Anseongella sp.]